jgi:hypothetical protein
MKTYTRPILVGLAAGALYGSWAAFANREHAVAQVARAAATQFALSFGSTTLLGLMIELVLRRGRGRANRLLATFGPHACLTVVFVAVHLLAETPNVARTIAPSVVVGLLFSVVYVWRRTRARPAS